MLNKKRGLSGVITVVILIALVLVAIVIIWLFINRTLKTELSQAEVCKPTNLVNQINIEKGSTCNDLGGEVLKLSIRIGDVETDELLVSISDGENAKTFTLTPGAKHEFVKNSGASNGYNDVLDFPGRNSGESYVVNLLGLGLQSAKEVRISPTIEGEKCGVAAVDSGLNVCDEEFLSCSIIQPDGVITVSGSGGSKEIQFRYTGDAVKYAINVGNSDPLEGFFDEILCNEPLDGISYLELTDRESKIQSHTCAWDGIDDNAPFPNRKYGVVVSVFNQEALDAINAGTPLPAGSFAICNGEDNEVPATWVYFMVEDGGDGYEKKGIAQLLDGNTMGYDTITNKITYTGTITSWPGAPNQVNKIIFTSGTPITSDPPGAKGVECNIASDVIGSDKTVTINPTSCINHVTGNTVTIVGNIKTEIITGVGFDLYKDDCSGCPSLVNLI